MDAFVSIKDTDDRTFECKRCHFNARNPSELMRHLQRKNSCDSNYSDVSCSDLMEELTNRVNDKKSLTCRFCDRKFSSRPSRCVHERSHKDPEKLVKEVQKMKLALQSLTLPQQTIINGNVTINQNVTNIQINEFLKEDDKHILNNKPFLQQCVRRRDKGLMELAEKIHFDLHKPENNNLRVSNKKLPYIQYFNGQKWMLGKKEKVLNDVIDKSYGIMQDHFEDHEDEIRTTSGALFRNIKEWMEQMSEKDKKMVGPLLDDLYLMIVNGGSK